MVWSLRGWVLGAIAGASRGLAMGSLNPRRSIWTTVGFWRFIREFLVRWACGWTHMWGILYDCWNDERRRGGQARAMEFQ